MRKERDSWGTNDIGVRALNRGVRTVRNGVVRIGRREFGGEILRDLEGKLVIVECADCWGTEYYVYTSGFMPIGKIVEFRNGAPVRIPGRKWRRV